MMNFMSWSLIRRNRMAMSAFAIGFAGVVTAQAAFAPQSGNYIITDPLPGDQSRPALALGSSGGFLVWEDNRTDGSGAGISAVALDAGFSQLFSPFRINGEGNGDQVAPQATLLKNGGAVFTWMGGRAEARQVYARFMTENKTWLTSDLRVNSNTNRAKAGVAVATLNNGNVIVVWASINQAGSTSMADIYGQLLSPTGTKIGAEFLINQFTKYNQRAPSVVALKNGGFAVAWVSEQQRLEVGAPSETAGPPVNLFPSVDIVGRLYTEAGAAVGSEFFINAGSAVCAQPKLAAGDTGFLAVWSEKNPLDKSNGWDIASRLFSNAGVGGTAATVNTFRTKDQLEPSVAAAGTQYFVAWTSQGQDGSREGVFARLVAADGTPDGDELPVNTTVVNQQLHPVVGSDGARFLTVWSSFTGLANSFDLFAQRYAEVLQPLAAMSAPFAYVPFNVVANVYQPTVQLSWALQAGVPVDHYEVYVDGNSTPAASLTTNVWVSSSFTAGSTHTFQVAYVLNDARRSPLSPAVSAKLWNGNNWGGIPFDWMTAYYGSDVSTWPAATAKLGGNGPTLLSVFLSGANPLQSSTWLRARLVQTPQGPFLNWNPQPGMIYQPQSSTDLVNWVNLGGPRFAAGSNDSMLVGGNRSGYYRLLRLR